MSHIVIIGGGASGMMAALHAAQKQNNRITLLERQARLGRKLLSTGNGRCNITNTGASPMNYHGEGKGFADYALSHFNPAMTLDFFSELGLVTVEEYGGRVYPMSNQANSVLDVLRFALERPNIAVKTGAVVTDIRRSGKTFKVMTEEETISCDKVIVACGGCAGSKLGGVMDGYKLLCSLGHTRTGLYPALTQIRTDPTYPKALKGIRTEAKLTVMRKGKVIAENEGEVLFSETGVSGTAVFEISRHVSSCAEGAEIRLDFFTMGDDKLRSHLAVMAKNNPDLPANQILTGTVHNRLGQMLCKYAGVGADMTIAQLSSKQIEAIAAACRSFTLKMTGVSGFETAQVTAGGIKTSEFDPKTMESCIIPGLYACGEVLDVDGDCGGYNLQWAWSSGCLAGRSAR